MFSARLPHLLTAATGHELAFGLLWAGLATLTGTLAVMMWTRWGQSRLIQKCLGLSVLAHLWLCGYSATVPVGGSPLPGPAPQPIIRVSLADVPPAGRRFAPSPRSGDSQAKASQTAADAKPWEEFSADPAAWVVAPVGKSLDRAPPAKLPDIQRQSRVEPAALPAAAPLEHLHDPKSPRAKEPVRVASVEPGARRHVDSSAQSIDAPKAQRKDEDVPPLVALSAVPPRVESSTSGAPTASRTQVVRSELPEGLTAIPPSPPRMDALPIPSSDPAAVAIAPPSPSNKRPRRSPASSVAAGAASKPPEEPEDYAGLALLDSDSARRYQATPSIKSAQSTSGAEDTPGGGAKLGQLPPLGHPEEKHDVPAAYSLRVAPDRTQVAQRHGATVETEEAVRAALKWLAGGQASDGRWSARQHGGGLELKTAGRDRFSAGLEADTGMTGLALLALLASGHTHNEGLYHENAQHGLEFLLRSQAADGNLGSNGSVYERMYCHAMATFAMSEALGMTGDSRLREPVRRALAYTIAAQNPKSGGWRYQPGDPGDTSQLGWQYMALKSGELAGIPIPNAVREGIVNFLQSVSSGRANGLTAYRASERERPTRTMTAEALACWQLLGMRRDHPAGREGADFLLEELPGTGTGNIYYWYYGTLAMYQLQGSDWVHWNDALRTALVNGQRKEGPLAGTWDPDTVWGGYGGRIYSTALSALCLEVYYRFLPLYREASADQQKPE
jgi:hypothetical protein